MVILQVVDSPAGKRTGQTGTEWTALRVIVEMAPLSVSVPRPDTQLVAELGYDSLGFLELVTALEDTFDLPEVGEERLLEVESVGDLLHLVAAVQRGARSRGV